MSTRVPIVVVMGATGTGKSKLAIQIAKKFNGEIISADSMQVYRGLDIASNKVTQAERAEVPHHLLDICRPTDRFTVLDFRHRTLPILKLPKNTKALSSTLEKQVYIKIDDILKRRKLPIIVGGTNYYIVSILWDSLTAGPLMEEDELADKHYHVLSKPELFDKWQTFEGFALPKLKRAAASEAVAESRTGDLVSAPATVDGVIRLSKSIETLVDEFGEGVSAVAEQLNVSNRVYLQTFYRLPDSSRTDQTADDVHLSQRGLEGCNFVDAELALLNHYLCACLRKIIDKLAGSDDSWRSAEICREFMNEYWDQAAVATAITEAVASKEDFGALLKKICDLCSSSDRRLTKCHEAVGDIYENLKLITKIRLGRLKFLRIMDDVSMVDYMNEELYNELKLVDMKATESIHPNSRRKIIRALQIYFQNGTTYSKFIEEQHQQEGAGGMFAPMRFPDACLLWLTCNQSTLTKRLNKRVAEMMKDGLIDELETFHREYNLDRLKHNIKADYSKGIFQSIGLKEFHDYLMLSAEKKSSLEGQKALQRGTHYLSVATNRYSKVQYRYVCNQFIKVPPEKTVPPLFELDCTDVEQWDEKVKNVAFDIVDAYLRGEDMRRLKYEPVPVEEPDLSRFQNGQYFCDTCQKLLIGQFHWQSHFASRGHRKQLYQAKVKEFQKKISTLRSTAVKEPDDSVEYSGILELIFSERGAS